MHISVIIPALNEAAYISPTLHSVTHQPDPWDITVVDGGSTDATVDRAKPFARVLHAPPGRARQMNTGAQGASGDVLLFLHADTLLPTDAFAQIRAALQRSNVEAGAFRLRFDRSSPVLRFYSLCTRLPLPGICFGDRGLFVNRHVFEAVGGFPELPLFEDVELVRALHRRGRFRFLPSYVTTAARRFEENGPLRQQVRNAYLWASYMLGADPHRLAHLYSYPVSTP